MAGDAIAAGQCLGALDRVAADHGLAVARTAEDDTEVSLTPGNRYGRRSDELGIIAGLIGIGSEINDADSPLDGQATAGEQGCAALESTQTNDTDDAVGIEPRWQN